MNHPRKKVVVAMSGGVDSSVAAALLKEQGYEVIGIMLRLWSENHTANNRCCTPSAMEDAESIADILEIPFYVKDYKTIFYDQVVSYFQQGHALGETPNPCLVCNREVRFGALLQEALKLGADSLATGHYARVGENKNQQFLLKAGLDERKDQSYMLHRLTQQQLSKALFPVGNYTKAEIRQLAKEKNLPVYKKADSQDLCFIGDDGHGNFLKRHHPTILRSGNIVNTTGKVLGTHQGLGFYTIGQRKGLGISWHVPLYVKALDYKNNRVILGEKEECFVQEFFANRVHQIYPEAFKEGEVYQAKIRYKSELIPMKILSADKHQMKIFSSIPLLGVTPGQSVVFYDNETCLGGAIIEKK